MQRHFAQAMDRIVGLIDFRSASSSLSQGVLLAVSGGVDSMCMADAFLKNLGASSFAVAHCNFHLRGEESNGDEAFVRAWAEKNGVRCHVVDFDTEAYSQENGISIEMAARELRYGWFAELCLEFGYQAVAVAHNANDNAETLILNLLRGSGLKGIGGMSLVSELPYAPAGAKLKLIRPLLECTRKQIEGYAFAQRIAFREDSTNALSDYKRNRIRNEVFPIFEKINPSFIRTLNSNMDYFSEASEIVDDYCKAHAPAIMNGKECVITVSSLLANSHWRYLLYYMLEGYGFNSSVLSSVEDLLVSERTFSGKTYESATHVLMTGRDTLKIVPKLSGSSSLDEPVMVVRCAGGYHFNGRSFSVEVLPWTEEMPLKQDVGILAFDADELKFPFVLRRWRQGDWMIPFGMKGRKKISDIFADMKYEAREKSDAVMVVDCQRDYAQQQRVAALACVRMDETYRIKPTTKNIIRLKEITL